jgi:hypothetical protein
MLGGLGQSAAAFLLEWVFNVTTIFTDFQSSPVPFRIVQQI